jgi:hypothetical protein
VAGFGVKNDGAGLDYFIPKEDQVKESDIPTSHQAGYIGVVIGAALNTKRYPIHKVEAFCKLINHPVILLGGKEDQETEILSHRSIPLRYTTHAENSGSMNQQTW